MVNTGPNTATYTNHKSSKINGMKKTKNKKQKNSKPTNTYYLHMLLVLVSILIHAGTANGRARLPCPVNTFPGLKW